MGVHVYLFSQDDVNVDCPNDPANIPGQGKAICHTVSDADGMFAFSGIPCGIVASAFLLAFLVNSFSSLWWWNSCNWLICWDFVMLFDINNQTSPYVSMLSLGSIHVWMYVHLCELKLHFFVKT